MDIVLHYHERYDGIGYPYGLKGEEIPLLARIMAIANSFDAMTSKRIYRKGMDLECVIDEIINNKGTQYDPELVDIFLGVLRRDGMNILSTKIYQDKQSERLKPSP